MSTQTNNFKIGAFLLVAVGLLTGGLFAFGIRHRFEPKTNFETYVPEDVEGLSVGSAVKLRGVPVGKVTRINFTWNDYPDEGKGYVLVEFEIKDSVSPLPMGRQRDEMLQAEIRRGLRARIKGQGITGTSIVSLEYLDPAENPPLKVGWTPSRRYIPSAPAQFSQMLGSIEKSLRNFEKLDFELISLTLQQSLDGMNSVLRKLEQFQFADIGTNVNGLVTELRSTNGKLKDFLGETSGTVKRMKLDELAHQADTLLRELTAVSARIDSTLQDVDSAPINQTIQNARQATDRLNAVLHDLKEYPSGFLFGQPPAAARSVERPRK
jgi:phospholipid/cholesterol/gamma-HCH transport system substrate-binding protein